MAFSLDPASRRHLVRRYGLGPLLRIASWGCCRLGRLRPGWVPTLDRPIFILGCSRGGTSLFADVFGRHRDLANWSEAAQVLHLDYYDPRRDDLRTEEDATEEEAVRLRCFFGGYRALLGRKRFVNKHPQNSLRIRYLRAIFPDAVFLHMIRDGRAVVASHCERMRKDAFRRAFPLGNFPRPERWQDLLALPLPVQFAHQWVDVTRYVKGTLAALYPPERILEVRYEEFCARPREVLRAADRFAGLDPDRRRSEEIPEAFPSQNFKWKGLLSAKEIREVEGILGESMRTWGYPESPAPADSATEG
ncbi:MAG: sulfotransferase [Planctomycetota bacterium]